MSETERCKAVLKVVSTCEGKPYGKGEWSVQDYIYSEYSVDIQGELSDKECISFLNTYYWDEFDQPSPYFLVEGLLFKKESTEELDPCYNASASWQSYGALEVDCTWYNGGAGFEEMIEVAIEKLEEK